MKVVRWLVILTMIVPLFVFANEETATEVVTIPVKGVKRAEVKIKLEGGSLSLTSGAGDLVDGQLTYYQGQDKPKVSYKITDGVAKVEIEGKGEGNRWQIELTSAVPIKLKVKAKQSTVQLKLSDLQVQQLELDLDKQTKLTTQGDG